MYKKLQQMRIPLKTQGINLNFMLSLGLYIGLSFRNEINMS